MADDGGAVAVCEPCLDLGTVTSDEVQLHAIHLRNHHPSEERVATFFPSAALAPYLSFQLSNENLGLPPESRNRLFDEIGLVSSVVLPPGGAVTRVVVQYRPRLSESPQRSWERLAGNIVISLGGELSPLYLPVTGRLCRSELIFDVAPGVGAAERGALSQLASAGDESVEPPSITAGGASGTPSHSARQELLIDVPAVNQTGVKDITVRNLAPVDTEFVLRIRPPDDAWQCVDYDSGESLLRGQHSLGGYRHRVLRLGYAAPHPGEREYQLVCCNLRNTQNQPAITLRTSVAVQRALPLVEVSGGIGRDGAVDFGDVYLGSSVTRELTLRNVSAEHTVEAALSGDVAARCHLSLPPVALAPGEERPVRLTYQPPLSGSQPIAARDGRFVERRFAAALQLRLRDEPMRQGGSAADAPNAVDPGRDSVRGSDGSASAHARYQRITTIPCRARTSESMVRVFPTEVDLGDCCLETLYSTCIQLVNLSDLPALLSIQYSSTSITVASREPIIGPRQSYDLRIDFVPHRVHPDYVKQITVVNRRNVRNENVVVLRANCADRFRVLYHALFYKLTMPDGARSNELHYGAVVAGHPYVRTFQVKNITDRELVLGLERSRRGAIELLLEATAAAAAATPRPTPPPSATISPVPQRRIAGRTALDPTEAVSDSSEADDAERVSPAKPVSAAELEQVLLAPPATPSFFASAEAESDYMNAHLTQARALQRARDGGALLPVERLCLRAGGEATVYAVLRIPPESRRLRTRLRPFEERIGVHLLQFDRQRLPPTHDPSQPLSPREILLVGRVCLSRMEVAQPHINFGHIVAGEQRAKTLLVQNLSEMHALYAIRKTGSVASGFMHFGTDRCGVLRPFSAKEIPFVFRPSLHGVFEESIRVENLLDGGDAHAITMKAVVHKRTHFRVWPERLDWGAGGDEVVTAGAWSRPLQFYVENQSDRRREFVVEVDRDGWAEAAAAVAETQLTVRIRERTVAGSASVGATASNGVVAAAAAAAAVDAAGHDEARHGELDTLEQKLRVAERKGKTEKAAKLRTQIQRLRQRGRQPESGDAPGDTAAADTTRNPSPEESLPASRSGRLAFALQRGDEAQVRVAVRPQAHTRGLQRLSIQVFEQRNRDVQRSVQCSFAVRSASSSLDDVHGSDRVAVTEPTVTRLPAPPATLERPRPVPSTAASSGDRLRLSSAMVNFGRVPIGATAERRLLVHNVGGRRTRFAVLEDTTVALPATITWAPARSTVDVHGVAVVWLRYRPESVGRLSRTLLVKAIAPAEEVPAMAAEVAVGSPPSMSASSPEVHRVRVLGVGVAQRSLLLPDFAATGTPSETPPDTATTVDWDYGAVYVDAQGACALQRPLRLVSVADHPVRLVFRSNLAKQIYFFEDADGRAPVESLQLAPRAEKSVYVRLAPRLPQRELYAGAVRSIVGGIQIAVHPRGDDDDDDSIVEEVLTVRVCARAGMAEPLLLYPQAVYPVAEAIMDTDTERPSDRYRQREAGDAANATSSSSSSSLRCLFGERGVLRLQNASEQLPLELQARSYCVRAPSRSTEKFTLSHHRVRIEPRQVMQLEYVWHTEDAGLYERLLLLENVHYSTRSLDYRVRLVQLRDPQRLTVEEEEEEEEELVVDDGVRWCYVDGGSGKVVQCGRVRLRLRSEEASLPLERLRPEVMVDGVEVPIADPTTTTTEEEEEKEKERCTEGTADGGAERRAITDVSRSSSLTVQMPDRCTLVYGAGHLSRLRASEAAAMRAGHLARREALVVYRHGEQVVGGIRLSLGLAHALVRLVEAEVDVGVVGYRCGYAERSVAVRLHNDGDAPALVCLSAAGLPVGVTLAAADTTSPAHEWRIAPRSTLSVALTVQPSHLSVPVGRFSLPIALHNVYHPSQALVCTLVGEQTACLLQALPPSLTLDEHGRANLGVHVRDVAPADVRVEWQVEVERPELIASAELQDRRSGAVLRSTTLGAGEKMDWEVVVVPAGAAAAAAAGEEEDAGEDARRVGVVVLRLTCKGSTVAEPEERIPIWWRRSTTATEEEEAAAGARHSPQPRTVGATPASAPAPDTAVITADADDATSDGAADSRLLATATDALEPESDAVSTAPAFQLRGCATAGDMLYEIDAGLVPVGSAPVQWTVQVAPLRPRDAPDSSAFEYKLHCASNAVAAASAGDRNADDAAVWLSLDRMGGVIDGARATQSITFTLTPHRIGVYQDYVLVEDRRAPQHLASVRVSMEVVAERDDAAATFTVVPPSIDYGSVMLGHVYRNKSILISNHTEAALEFVLRHDLAADAASEFHYSTSNYALRKVSSVWVGRRSARRVFLYYRPEREASAEASQVCPRTFHALVSCRLVRDFEQRIEIRCACHPPQLSVSGNDVAFVLTNTAATAAGVEAVTEPPSSVVQVRGAVDAAVEVRSSALFFDVQLQPGTATDIVIRPRLAALREVAVHEKYIEEHFSIYNRARPREFFWVRVRVKHGDASAAEFSATQPRRRVQVLEGIVMQFLRAFAAFWAPLRRQRVPGAGADSVRLAAAAGGDRVAEAFVDQLRERQWRADTASDPVDAWLERVLEATGRDAQMSAAYDALLFEAHYCTDELVFHALRDQSSAVLRLAQICYGFVFKMDLFQAYTRAESDMRQRLAPLVKPWAGQLRHFLSFFPDSQHRMELRELEGIRERCADLFADG
ncbi:hypothetical protein CDCA_CDCA07G2038 [Cyanidium caldarium]|uniref:MSP domain-containing protein n=1 Tax=Cyanidium caldarium TaxID=2771 RepID=A0AAV9IW34_CYACA|nr:hypothetical protein CDCA_CDCA07G2038 [Cyanidium caldarium]